ncbi:TRAP transporter large permease [Moorella sp. ACPs]|uniref:TRAP transporter large permease n=1 Tax=Neomoorella carbonis TaxID=3062783 RepID=UPI003872F8CC
MLKEPLGRGGAMPQIPPNNHLEVTVMIMFIVFILLIGAGVPIGFGLCLSAIIYILFSGNTMLLNMFAQRLYAGINSYTLLAIPFFILTGLLMNTGGITNRIFKFASNLVGHIAGGLGHVSVLASMIVAGMSGSAVAEAAGLGAVEIKAMTDQGYDNEFAAAITAASSTIGPIIPPSIPFVLFSGLTGVSVGRLFLGGIIPGLLMGLGLMITVYFIARKRKYPTNPRANFKDIAKSLLDALPSLLVPLIVIGGILGGIFTPTEAASVAALYAFVLGVFVYKEIDMQSLLSIIRETVSHTIRVMFIIGAAAFFGWVLTYQGVPDLITQKLMSLTENKYLILLIIELIGLILGCFLESLAILVLTIPIFMPLVQHFGIDPVHFGVTYTLCLMIGLITPPVGMSLYPVISVAKVPLHRVAKACIPYIIALILVVLIITFIPWLVTLVPNLIMGQA